MFKSEKIVNQADSLIDLLAAQCGDLEKLLTLAREETLAVKKNDFEGILRIVTERDKIGQRLEIFQKQINDLHNSLETKSAKNLKNELTERIIKIANLTLKQDKKNKAMLDLVREKTVEDFRRLEKSLRGTNAYLHDRQKGLAYNQKA